MAVALQFDEFDDALNRLAVRYLGAPHARQEQHFGDGIGRDARMPAGQKIFQHAHLREQFAVLERAGEPEAGDLVRLRGRRCSVPRNRIAPLPR